MNLRELVATARRLMIEAGFEPNVPPAADAQMRALAPLQTEVEGARDLRGRLWSSIDNEQSRDLDQIEWAERRGPDRTLLSIGLADVDERFRPVLPSTSTPVGIPPRSTPPSPPNP
jgi:hypothetical protein